MPGGRKIDHSTAGAQWVYCALRKYGATQGIGELFGQMLGLCIASHHGEGLIDCLDESGNAVWIERLVKKEDKLTRLAECE
ncbi:HD domain-containing protein [Aggregatibacter actinomycetemcomitans]|nr:hypothetical protein [Aggregatibacter actinomycetemcomitans]